MTITAFLLARIAEDEAVAREANPPHAGRTFYSHFGHGADDWGVYYFNVPIERVLAECAAKRRIVEVHAPTDGTVYGVSGLVATDRFYCTRCCTGEGGGLEAWPCGTVVALASAYASHPDFDPAWQSPVSASLNPTQE